MHRFFVNDAGVQEMRARLDPEEARHAARVLRLAPGEEVELLDGLRRYRARLTAVAPDGAEADVLEALPDNEPDVRVTLYQGLPKAEKMEWIVQKCTELGVHAIQPVLMERCVARAEGKDGARKAERWQRIAREAVKQCGRARVPQVAPPRPLAALCGALAADYDLVLVPWEEAHAQGLRTLVPGRDARRIAIVVGPEGGMAAGEVERLTGLGAQAVTLGPRILRTETAGMAALTMALCLAGQME